MGPSGVNPPPPPRRCVSCVFGLTLPSSMSATPASGNFSMTSSTKSSSGHLFGSCSGSSWYAGYPLATTVTSDLLWVLLFKVAAWCLRMWWHTVVALTLGVPTRQPRAPLALPVIALIAVVSIVVSESAPRSLSVRVRRCALVLSLSLSLKLLAFVQIRRRSRSDGQDSTPCSLAEARSDATFPTTFPRAWWPDRGSAPRGGGGDEGAQWPRWHSQRDTRPPESTAAFSRCAFRAFSVPSDRNRSPRAGVRGASILAGAARERRWRRPGGWRGSIRALETSQSDRRAPIREAHGHIIYIPGSLRGRGRAWMGGQWVDMRGVCPGLVQPERRCDTLRCS